MVTQASGFSWSFIKFFEARKLKKVLLSFWGLESSISRNIRTFFSGWFFFTFLSLSLKVAQVTAYITNKNFSYFGIKFALTYNYYYYYCHYYYCYLLLLQQVLAPFEKCLLLFWKLSQLNSIIYPKNICYIFPNIYIYIYRYIDIYIW